MYISIDVGGTNTRVAGADNLENPVFLSEPIRRKNSHNFDNDLNFMVKAALEIANGKKIEALGISTPGSTNKEKTEIKSARNLKSWIGKPLVDLLSSKLDCPVFYDNDAISAVLGEAYYGHIQGDFDFIIWGTGIGGATIKQNNSNPIVSVLNWHTYFDNWEKETGGAELAKRLSKSPEKFTDEDWMLVDKNFKRHLIGYIQIRKPKIIVFGGGLAVKHTEMIEKNGRSFDTQIYLTQFGDDSGLIGGFGIIRSNLSSEVLI